MNEIATWAAPAATMIAAMMTAANLGSRVTGWGFVVFTVGSLLWSYIGISTDQNSLLITNGFLTAVNLIGVWRWLGRQAKFEDGSEHASERSSRSNVPTLFSAASLAGRKFVDRGGSEIGQVVDAMLHCDGKNLAYLVVTDGGVTGLHEHLRAIDPAMTRIDNDSVTFSGSSDDFERLNPIQPDDWPSAL